ncbi:MAG TPA: ribosomal protein L7/L12 [Pseudobacteroides sp.]|nr:ribosomal protein L7/L12 [Pseudobacteroides sp.]
MNDITIWWIIPLLVLILISFSSSINQLRNEIKRTNTILEKIAKQIGVPEPPVDSVIRNLVAEGKKIEAIKRYREITGVGLKEAKDYIDSIKIY